MRVMGCSVALAAAVLAGLFPARGSNGQAANGRFLFCRAIHLESPDRRWLLGSDCTFDCPPGLDRDWNRAAVPVCSSNNGLFLRATSTRDKEPIEFDGYSGNAVWSPDNAAFFVNDHSASDRTDSALYTVDPLRKIDAAGAIRNSDPAAVHYFHGHRYFIAQRWIDNHTALVQFCGHTDEFPVVEFDFHYRVGIDGSAQRISRRLTRPSLDHPDCE